MSETQELVKLAKHFANGGDEYSGAEVRVWVYNLTDTILYQEEVMHDALETFRRIASLIPKDDLQVVNMISKLEDALE